MDNVDKKLTQTYTLFSQVDVKKDPRIVVLWKKVERQGLKEEPSSGSLTYPHNTALVKKT
ncbi:MAG: hypothetical protein EOM37_06215 [Proteobacteria bacterium]|nr:hypothetical protein [Pseudomonadota bacterium]